MADEDKDLMETRPVVIVGQSAHHKHWPESEDDQRSLKPRAPSAPCTSTLDSKKSTDKLGEKPNETKDSNLQMLERKPIDSIVKQRESSELIQNIMLENVSLASPFEDAAVTVVKIQIPPSGHSSVIGTTNNAKLEPKEQINTKKSEDDGKDQITELRTPERAKTHLEWVSGDSSWTRNDYLQKVHLKPMNRSEVLIREKDKELERKASVGPCCIHRNANEKPSGISISIPRKSSKNMSAETARPIKTGICLSKKSTMEINPRPRSGDESKRDREAARAPTFFVQTPTPTECNVTARTDIHAGTTKDVEFSAVGPSKHNKMFFRGLCGKLCNKIKTLF